MSFNWEDYLRFAEQLNNNPSEPLKEAKLRSAVSRAYYSAFCYTADLIDKTEDDYLKHNESDHQLVPDYLEARGLYKIAEYLNDLRESRNNCDYDSEVEITGTVTGALWRSRQVIDALRFGIRE
jgi:uncharacterized protein (UPF0332 family)